MAEGLDATWERVYCQMGLIGWAPSEVDGMEPWLIARFLGDDDFDPVIRGVRDGLRLPSDPTGGGTDRKRKGGQSFGRFDPRKLIRRDRDPGTVLRGDAAR